MTGEWIEHDGSEWPKHAKPEDRVVVRFRDGYEMTDDYTVQLYHGRGDERGSNWYWDTTKDMSASEIAAYRIVASWE